MRVEPSPNSSNVNANFTDAPGRLTSTTAPRSSLTSANLHSTGGPPPLILVSPRVPAAKGPSSLTDSTAGSTAAQFSTSAQNPHATSLPTGHSTECVNV